MLRKAMLSDVGGAEVAVVKLSEDKDVMKYPKKGVL